MSQPTEAGVSKTLLLLNGPGLDKLGEIHRDVYGASTLDEVKLLCEATCRDEGYVADFRQSNDTGELLEWIVAARWTHVGIIINPAIETRNEPRIKAAYAAIMHALAYIKLPTVEVHISNLFAQNEEPRVSYDSTVSLGLVCGFGVQGYVMAIKGMVEYLSRRKAV
jgi:3-dehydroquinate dehydratase-2